MASSISPGAIATYFLDTNAVSDLMGSASLLDLWLATLPETASVITCPIVRGEILYGLERIPEGKRRAKLKQDAMRLLDRFPCEPIPPNAAERYAATKWSREKQGLSMVENDLWIAATALALGATLVTRETDFDGIEGLTVLAIR